MLTVGNRNRFTGDINGVAALEFAICAPVLILLLLAGTDALRAFQTSDNVDAIANTVAEMIAEHRTDTINYQDLQFYHDAAMLTYPHLLSSAFESRRSWDSTISISMSSVDFGPAQSGCSTSCVYTPKMVWTGGSAPRSCTVPMIAVDDDAPPAPTTLPRDIFGPGSIIIVDIVYTYQPLLQVRFFPQFNIKRSYYVSVRFNSVIQYKNIQGDNGIVSACSSYT